MYLLAVAYLLGSIPSGLLIARLLGLKDPRQSGSGNIGAANLTRLGGKKVGALTFVLDFAKGFVPVLTALLLFPESTTLHSFVALLAVVGHCYSIFLVFHGGKGVATAAGVLFPIAPLPMLLALTGWLICFYCFRIASLAAFCALGLLSGALLLSRADSMLLLVAILISLIVIRRHDENLRSLLVGVERSFQRN